jgi:RNA-directed DNA polymerase
MKRVFTSRKHKRMILGLVLTDDGNISLGRKQKMAIKSLVFKYRTGELSPERVSYLSGYLAFARSVEPGFLKRLDTKYGPGTVARIRETGLVEAHR